MTRILTYWLAISVLITGLAGCAAGHNPDDPYENYNRKVFAFNRQVDKYVYRPVAQGYKAITPMPVRKGLSNFFSNIRQLPIMGNDLLQGNFEWFAYDTARFIINTTVGIGGLFDVATAGGIEKHEQDFGLTMAKWGVRESPYFLLPFLPPTTPRDGLGAIGDYFMSPWPYVGEWWWSYVAYGVPLTETRASLIGPDQLMDEAFDPYTFLRDAYMQRRQAQIERILNPHGDAEKEVTDTQPSDESTES